MELTLAEVAAIVEGTVHGDAARVVRGVCSLDCTGPEAHDHLAFVSRRAGLRVAHDSSVGALLVADLPDPPGPHDFVTCADPYLGFALVAGRFHPLPRASERRIHATAVVAADAEFCGAVEVGPHAVISAGARIAAGTILGPGVFIGPNARIGSDCVIDPHVVIHAGCVLGDRVRILANAVIGSEGFGNAKQGEAWVHMPQIGNVVIGDDVEIGACTTVDRATLGSTCIGRGVKIDNLVMVAHNCTIGEDTALAGQVGMAGSTKIGNRCMLGGQVGLAGHIELADDVVIGAKGGVMNSVAKPGFYVGIPIRPGHQMLEILAAQTQLTGMRKQLRELRRRVTELEAESS